jgi:large repetitive protein
MGPGLRITFRRKLPLFVLSLACLACIPAAHAQCAVSGVPVFSGAPINPDAYGNMFYTETGGSGSVSIQFTATSGCTYFVASDSSWLTTSVNSPTVNQSASMTVTFLVAFNNANFRTGHLTVYVNGLSVNSVTIDQNSLACQLVITSANPISFPSGGGTATVTFNTGGCLYVGPNFSSSWMNVATGGLGPSAVTFNVLPNTGQARSGTVSFSSPPGQILTVNQAGTGTAPALTLNCSPIAGPTLVGLYYAASCNGAGGVPPYTWSLATFTSCGNLCAYYGQLPQGIGFNSNGATAQFTGTPTTAGPYLYGPLMTDSNGTTATVTYSGTIAGGPLALNCVPTTGPTTVGTPYTATCTASGGAPPYTWSITTGLGSLPPNLTLTTNGSTATISGTPTGAGALGYSYILQLADSASATLLQPYTGTLGQGSQAATITSLIPSSATAGGNGFTMTVLGAGFASGATVNWNSTALSTSYIDPSQLQAVVASNLIASPGTVAVTVTSGNVTTSPVNFTINSNTAPLTINCLPATGPAAEGVTYLATCTASGGTTPYNWSIASGTLPQGLAPGATTGSSFTISGTPTSTGAYSYAVKVVDSSTPQQAQSQPYSGTITLPPASITSLNCSAGANGPSTVGVWYTDTCMAPNGTAPFSWSISAGALPAGVTLNASTSATAAISGTPTAAGSYSYTLTVSDSSSPAPLSASLAFSGSVAPAGSATLTVVPANLTFSYRPDISPPAAQSLSVFTTAAATTFTVAVNAVWLSATPLGGQPPGTISISVNAGTLAPGTYNALVTVNAFNVSPLSVTIPVTLIVQPAPQPQLTLGQTQFAYGLTQGSAPTQGQVLVMNSGGGVLSFTTAVTGCSCVSVSTASGQASPGAPAAVAFTVNPTGLPPATYNSQIVITPSVGQPVTVPVTIAVNSLTQSIVVTQNGLLFETVAGAAPPSQSFNVLNAGQGLMSFTLTTQTLSGGQGWLTVNPSSSSVAAGSISTPVTVSVNPAGLAAGQYYGQVQVTAANAGNSPQIVSVLLNVVDPSQGAILASPTGVLVGPATGTVTLSNLSTQAISYISTISTADGGNWVLATPSTGTVPAQSSVQVTVSGNASLLPSGTGQGVVRFGFSNGTVQSVAVSSLSIPVSCQSSYLVPTVTGPIGPSFTVTQSQPVSLNVSVVDNCNNIIPLAAVTANFSDKDPSIALVPQGNGIWSGTWTPKTAQPQMSVEIVATAFLPGARGIAGTFQLTGTVQPAANAEAPAPAAALNSANVSGTAQISPGTWMTIFGDRLANGTSSASGPFPPSLVGTTVMIGATALPLDYVSPTQVNALLPFSLTPNAIVSLVVQRNATVSVPIDVTIADIGPAIFAVNGVGTGQGAVTIATSGVLAAPVGAFPGSQPVKRGDFLAIYCTGLGAVNNTPADGAPAPSSPPLATTLANPTVTIGGVPAVVSYSGLAPGLVGLYQVNVQVPDSSPTGNAVNLAISVGSLTSNTVTVAVQ